MERIHTDSIKQIFETIDRISRKLDYIEKSFSVFAEPVVYNDCKSNNQKKEEERQ